MSEAIRYYAPGARPKRSQEERFKAFASPELRQALHKAQRGRCYLCGGKFAGQKDSRLTATADHVKPRTRGGLNYRNILLAHKQCNENKSNREPYAHELLYCEAIYKLLDAGSNFDAGR